MKITFHYEDGYIRILRPVNKVPVSMIHELCHDFGAIRFVVS